MHVLICDDQPSIRLLFRSALEQRGIEVSEARTGEECLTLVARNAPDAVILDIFLPGRDGLSVLPQLGVQCPDMPVFVVSAHANHATFRDAIALGATACFEKLAFVDELPELLRGTGAAL